MDHEQAWALTREVTRLTRQRKHLLYTFGDTKLPYRCLVPDGDRVRVHAGAVTVQRPKIAMPGLDDVHDFEGFVPDGPDGADPANPSLPDGARMIPVWIARRISLPGGKYVNDDESAHVEDGPLAAALERAERRLDDEHDIRTAVLASDRRVWRLSVLLYVAGMIERSAASNVMEHLEHRFPDGPPDA